MDRHVKEGRMNIETYSSYTHLKQADVSGKTVAVIDTLRASTVIIEALKNGCRGVIPVADMEQAAIVKRNGGDEVLLGGEINCDIISGFDLGNSPLEYSKKVVNKKMVVLFTTNGTKSIAVAGHKVLIYVAALANAAAIAKKLSAANNDVLLLCAGTNGKFSAEDVITAGAILSRMEDTKADMCLDDLSIFALSMYKSNRKNLQKFLSSTKHYNILKEAGYEQDIDFCLQEDTVDIVPVYADSTLTIDK